MWLAEVASGCPPSKRRKDSSHPPNGHRQVSELVLTHRGDEIRLKKPAGATMIIGPLEDTVYRGGQREVYGWGHFFLPESVNMTVVGVVKGISCPGDQVVVMTCENNKVYAYDGEELHPVASDLKCLLDEGMNYPASKSYYKGEAFKDMTKDDWAAVRNSDVGKRLDQEHNKLVTANKSRFLENLRISRSNRGLVS
ncbi:uncharacterized protein LOC125020447 isoform X2 [Mugil cephalus]|uniref:uncharacterized protein LOC125020447 isoform X2 n=1 Tax=Mugil cephalus TaxID=48193 RepID=UPI001FB78C4A|nr:uncharacterized protein LOC125020447 isoform X2 [Mugil cephalus]XP_047461737.1 uncharacterized protein LOC125020447 isoform X2 [Mugil cephalus]XP_047461738.1 uncharacterized protein LOC125020447 isoform X2 [Mugil cephalus]XP_047461739.1 uncharacterized protein LOC125020447 isoform X2 [Mugil cephalus]XP_047461740.1 uncharacterized protein LOC125020447 isoform X2 [Mugil cephalus]XP_047461741.1 uncharacterized protein LOC125020447 isoform X2 [Mugil cephalus]